MRAYLQMWTQGANAARDREGEPLEHAASDQHERMGIQPGDALYIVYLEAKRLHLIGRLSVAEIIDRREATLRRGENLWEAEWWAVARPEVVDPIVFDRRVSDEDVRKLRFEQATGKVSRLDVASDGAINGQRLQSIRRLTAASAALLDGLRESEANTTTHGRARMTKAEQDAVEYRAMEVTEEHYTTRNWEVERVHLHRPYDLVCRRGADEHHVEVKGSSGRAITVELTRNEVTHARECRYRAVLAVVDCVELERGDPPIAAGGRLRLDDTWLIEDEDLEPLNFRYTLSDSVTAASPTPG